MAPDGQAQPGWNVPYFGVSSSERTRTTPRTAVFPFVGDPSPVAGRVLAVFIAIGGVVAGAGVVGLLFIASFVLSFGSEPSRADVAVTLSLGGLIAVFGLIAAVMTWRHAAVRSMVTVTPAGLELGYRAFGRAIVVPREAVRAVTIDDTPPILFTKNERFPIAGALPQHVFADALDNLPRLPWEDFDPERGPGAVTPGVIVEDTQLPVGGYRHDDPAEAGWASSATATGPVFGRQGYLWSGDGSSLPFLRLGPADVPNVAILFERPQKTPRAPWWFAVAPPASRAPLFFGGRSVSGVLLRLRDPHAAAAAFTGWGIVRPISADDVLEKGLRVAKPLRGWRIPAYVILFLAPFVIQALLRRF